MDGSEWMDGWMDGRCVLPPNPDLTEKNITILPNVTDKLNH